MTGSALNGSTGGRSTVLTDVLAAVRGGVPPAAVAARLGRDAGEVEAAIGYWVHSGVLTVTSVDCATADCGECPLRSAGCAPGPGRFAARPGASASRRSNRTAVNILTS